MGPVMAMDFDERSSITNTIRENLDAMVSHEHAGNRRYIANGTLELVYRLMAALNAREDEPGPQPGPKHEHRPGWAPQVVSVPSVARVIVVQQCECGAVRRIQSNEDRVGAWQGGAK